MPLLWLVPAVVLAAGLAAVTMAASAMASEAGRLRAAVRDLEDLRPAVADVGSAAAALREALEWFRRP